MNNKVNIRGGDDRRNGKFRGEEEERIMSVLWDRLRSMSVINRKSRLS